MRSLTRSGLIPVTIALSLAACSGKAGKTDTATTVSQAGAIGPAAPAPIATDDQLASVARTMVKAALIKPNERVFIGGGVRDNVLLEDLAIEAMKVGAQPVISVWSDRLSKRSYDEVPASFDTLSPRASLALINNFDVALNVDFTESDSALAGVDPKRIAARARTGQVVTDALKRRGVRVVALGNGLYPTDGLAKRLGISRDQLATIFWRASAVPPETIRAKGDSVRAELAASPQVTLTAPNGTNATFKVNPAHAVLSDGALTPEKVKQGFGSMQTWLPAGELLVSVDPASVDGKIVFDHVLWNGTDVSGLTLTFTKGKLASMTATSGLAPLQAAYDAATGAKDRFTAIDIGLNPEVKLPQNTGAVVYMAAGAILVQLGDDQMLGGSNVSTLNLGGQVPSATLTAGGKPVIDRGTLK
jgi:leucyl aminopeptidase (aminopeptidase T)